MSTPSALAADAALATALVREAAGLAARMRAEGVDAARKRSISDIVTEADTAAEALVLDRLRRERPDDGVLGEEGAERPARSGRTWVLDPVDGTYNFYAGLDWWCSAIALVEGDVDQGRVLLGAIHHPEEDVTLLGGPGLPSTRDGVPLPALEDRPLAESCLTTYLHPPWYDGPVGEAFTRAVAGVATLRMLGSASRDATAIATGRLHVTCQHSMAPWDWLPGAAIIQGVGGAARRTTAAGVEWSVAGAPTAVAEVIAALECPLRD